MRCIALFLISFSGVTWGNVPMLENLGAPTSVVQENGVRVPVHEEAMLHTGGNPVRLYLTGVGLRKKRLGFANVSGYFALSYTDDPQGIDITDPLQSLQQNQAKAVALVAVRSLTSFQVRNEIEDALIANQVDTLDPAVDRILSRLTFNVPKGTSVVVATARTGAEEELWVEFPQQVIHSQGPNLGQKFWSGWFGVPFDSGMKKLKEALLGQSPPQWPFHESFLLATQIPPTQ